MPGALRVQGSAYGRNPSRGPPPLLTARIDSLKLLLDAGTVVGLMKLSTDYDEFHAQLNKIAPVYPDNPTLFDDPKDWEMPK